MDERIDMPEKFVWTMALLSSGYLCLRVGLDLWALSAS